VWRRVEIDLEVEVMFEVARAPVLYLGRSE
jgi:hypothetical protein